MAFKHTVVNVIIIVGFVTVLLAIAYKKLQEIFGKKPKQKEEEPREQNDEGFFIR